MLTDDRLDEIVREDSRRRPRSVLRFGGAVAIGIVAAVLLRTFVFECFVVPSESMLDTLQVSDFFIGEKITYKSQQPRVGDIITFRDPDGSGTILVKRVVATGGQTVDMHDGRVFVDGQELDEPYVGDKPSYPLQRWLGDQVEYPYVVPDGELWVMGDNRTNSLDSRYFGSIKVSDVTSRAACIIFPKEHAREL